MFSNINWNLKYISMLREFTFCFSSTWSKGSVCKFLFYHMIYHRNCWFSVELVNYFKILIIDFGMKDSGVSLFVHGYSGFLPQYFIVAYLHTVTSCVKCWHFKILLSLKKRNKTERICIGFLTNFFISGTMKNSWNGFQTWKSLKKKNILSFSNLSSNLSILEILISSILDYDRVSSISFLSTWILQV